MKVEFLQVVMITYPRGKGRDGDPVREVVSIHDMKGNKIMEFDPCAAEQALEAAMKSPPMPGGVGRAEPEHAGG